MAPRTKRPGTMRERPPGSGHWQLRAFVGSDPVTGKPRQVSRTFIGGERAAARALAQLVAEVEAGKFRRTTATVAQLLEHWLEASASTQRPRTLYENRRKIERRIRPALGAVRLDQLDAHKLDAFYRTTLADGLAPATVHKLHAILSAACRQAVKWGWLDRAPTESASPPSPKRKPMAVPTPEQLSTLIRAAEDEDPVLATAIALAALTGLRRGELVALRWSDIDLERGRVHVAKSLTVANGTRYVGPTKTHQTRDVALDPIGIAVLRQHRAFIEDLAARAASPLVVDPFVLSSNANGAVALNPDTLTHGFARLCRKMEAQALAERRRSDPTATRDDLAPADRWPFRFHDLRHFSVTTLIAAGVDVRTVAERHGHARATMTLDRYAHALPERDRQAAAVLGHVVALGQRREPD
jgi:integrase